MRSAHPTYSRETKMTDNIWEELAFWQQHDEEANLKTIFQHELETVKPEDLGQWFRSELKRRGLNG